MGLEELSYRFEGVVMLKKSYPMGLDFGGVIL